MQPPGGPETRPCHSAGSVQRAACRPQAPAPHRIASQRIAARWHAVPPRRTVCSSSSASPGQRADSSSDRAGLRQGRARQPPRRGRRGACTWPCGALQRETERRHFTAVSLWRIARDRRPFGQAPRWTCSRGAQHESSPPRRPAQRPPFRASLPPSHYRQRPLLDPNFLTLLRPLWPPCTPPQVRPGCSRETLRDAPTS